MGLSRPRPSLLPVKPAFQKRSRHASLMTSWSLLWLPIGLGSAISPWLSLSCASTLQCRIACISSRAWIRLCPSLGFHCTNTLSSPKKKVVEAGATHHSYFSSRNAAFESVSVFGGGAAPGSSSGQIFGVRSIFATTVASFLSILLPPCSVDDFAR